MLKLAEQGDHRNVDMLVKDIYGGAYHPLGLPAELIASSFGKAARSVMDRQGNNNNISNKNNDDNVDLIRCHYSRHNSKLLHCELT